MEDRYEFKGKIGQGGLGTVYKAHDVRMNREVAIKRILNSLEDSSISEEATRQLEKEAGSLASLQHPNIVTIYDVGSDEDGPYVVMELLTGNTLEEIIGNGSFTWQDFRNLAMQTMEALIAAQELHLVHRDLKPSNIMLTWLPSGKFQVKIVDFGLAKLSASPSLQTIDQSDGVFGSIYFMAPEQFERVPIDLKADLYAIGCVFYYALTGVYPFDGDTAPEVMASHLRHSVTPIQEVREGIPLWACEWIMWHLNRQPADRPESARESLKFFLESDTADSSPVLSTGTPSLAPEQPKRPKLLIPGAAPVPEAIQETTLNRLAKTASTPKPLIPPDGSKPSVHTSTQLVHSTPSDEPAEMPQEPETATQIETPPEPSETAAEPVEVQPVEKAVPAPPVLKRTSSTPTSSSSSLGPGTAPAVIPTSKVAAPTGPASPTAVATEATVPAIGKTKKKGIPNGVKMAVATILGILAVFAAFLLLKKSGDNAEAKLFNEMILKAAKEDATEVPVDENKLEILLRNAVSVASNKDRYTIYKALFLAKATDGTDVDARIAEFATTREMIPDIRVVLIRDVLRKRGNPAIIGTLLDFAQSTDEPKAAVAAIEASRFMASDVHLQAFLDVLRSTKDDTVRKAAEENIATIVDKSSSPSTLAETLSSAYESESNQVVKHSILRLMGRAGGEKALATAKANLESEDVKDKIAAIVALGTWRNQEGFKLLLNYLSSETNLDLRSRAYNSAYQYTTQTEEILQENWTLLAENSKLQNEQMTLIRGLANIPPTPWSFALLQEIISTSDSDEAVNLAERAVIRLKDIQKIQGNPKEDE